jgi:hypothetical protein
MSVQEQNSVPASGPSQDGGRGWRLGALGGLVAGAGFLVVRRLRHQRSDDRADSETANRWHAVTVNRSPDEVMPDGTVPPALRALGDLVEVEVRPAPQARGTELRARLRRSEPRSAASVLERLGGTDPRQAVRAALREDKQLLEVGEVLRLEPIPHGDRGHTPGGKLVETVAKRAGGEGLS